MSYREDERKRAIKIRDELFRDPGAGIFSNIEREFVLQDPTLNLWAGISAGDVHKKIRNLTGVQCKGGRW